MAGSAGLEAIRGMCPPGTTLIAAEDLPARGWFPVRVVALRGRGLAPVAYSVTLNSKNVLFSGRIPIQSKTVMEQALVTEISRSRAAAIDYLIAVNQLSSLKPDLWLPAAIADDQNANIYDGEWQNIVNFNYRVGFHCARERGLLPPSSAVARAAGDPMDDNCLRLAREFTGSTRETASLRGIDEVLGVRGRVGLAVFRAELDSLGESPDSAGELLRRIGSLELYEGCFAEAAASLRKSLESTSASSLSASDQGDVTALLALAAIKQCGLERANAFIQGVAQAPPLKSPEAETRLREAVGQLTQYLETVPDDLRIRWLLNLAIMTLGEYPAQVPRDWLIPMDERADGSSRSIREQCREGWPRYWRSDHGRRECVRRFQRRRTTGFADHIARHRSRREPICQPR